MLFELQKFLKSATTPYHVQFEPDFSGMDFTGYSVRQPVQAEFDAKIVPDGAELALHIKASVDAECARCLEPVTETYDFTREYHVRPVDLEDPDFELPIDEKGCMDLRELAYQELIFEVPRVLLCSPDCSGLCPICGKSKAAGCSCQKADDAAPVDARLGILKQLLS